MDKDNVWPIVKNAELCDTILSGYMIYPIKLELICTIRNNSIFTWFVSDEDTDSNNATWAEVSNGFLLNVTDEHVGRFLKLKILPIDGDRIGPEFEVVSKNAIITGPVKCPFEDRHEFTQEKLPGSNEFRVVTYNLLADTIITPEMFPTKFPWVIFLKVFPNKLILIYFF